MTVQEWLPKPFLTSLQARTVRFSKALETRPQRQVPALSMLKARTQSKYRSSVPFRRTSRVTQWGPPPSSLECRSLSGMTSRPSFSRS